MLHAWNICNNSGNVKNGIKIIGSQKYGKLKRDRSKNMSGVNSPQARSIYQVNIKTGKIKEKFALIKDATLKTKINRDGISQCCRGERKSIDGWLWFFSENYTLEKAISIICRINNPLPNIMSKEVYKVDIKTGKIIECFPSMNIASKKIKGRVAGISQCCLGHRNFCNNYLWFYKENYTLEKALILIDKINSPKHRSVCQINITTGKIIETFKNIKEAGEKSGINKVQIGECCRGTKDFVKNYLWVFKEDLVNLDRRLKITQYQFLEQLKNVYRLDQVTFDILEEFQTVKEANQKYSGNISLCCKGKQALAAGELWCLAKDYNKKYASAS